MCAVPWWELFSISIIPTIFCGSAAISIAPKHIQTHFRMKLGPVETSESTLNKEALKLKSSLMEVLKIEIFRCFYTFAVPWRELFYGHLQLGVLLHPPCHLFVDLRLCL